MSEDTARAFQIYHDAAVKYDYYVTGAAGAVCAFVVTSFKPERLAISANSLELLALLVLLFSVIAGFKRIHNNLWGYKAAAYNVLARAHETELAVVLRSQAATPGQTQAPAPDLEALLNTIRAFIPKTDEVLKKATDRSEIWSRLQHYALAVGAFMLVVARVLTAYAAS
jgi:hypothetical protein